MRSPREVLESHLALRLEGKIEEDLQTNFAEDVVLIDSEQIYQGFDGIRASNKVLEKSLPEAAFTYQRVVVEGRLGYLIWHASLKKKTVEGVDSFLIEGGKIRMQTVYYRA